MARFSKFKFLYALKLNLNGANFIKKYHILIVSKSWKNQIKFGEKLNICDKTVKFEVENLKHLHSNTRVNLK